MSEYVPTTPEVNGIRNGWACAHVREDITPEAAYAAFDRWLSETIREAKAEALREAADRIYLLLLDSTDEADRNATAAAQGWLMGAAARIEEEA